MRSTGIGGRRRFTTEGGGACPVCGEAASARIDLADYRLFSCAACGCWSSDAGVRGASLSFEPTGYFDRPDVDRERWSDLLRRRADAGGPLRAVLDVGCGNGAFLDFVAGAHPEARRHGIEIDPARAAEARHRDPEARILEGDALVRIPAAEGPFDLITMWDVFEHVPAPADLLQGLATKLADGGWIFIQTMHEDSLLPRLGRAAYRWTGGRIGYLARRTHEPHHLAFFTRRGLQRMADRCALEIVDLWWGRLARARMDGHPAVTAATAAVLRIENALGNGLFVNVVFQGGAGVGSVGPNGHEHEVLSDPAAQDEIE